MKNIITTWVFTLVLAICYGQTVDEVNDHHDPDAPYADSAEMMNFKATGMPGVRLGAGLPALRIELPRTGTPDRPYYKNIEQPEVQPSGYSLPAPPGLLRGTRWTKLPNGGHVVAIEFRSENAQALRVLLTDFGRDGVELRVYDPKDGYTLSTKPPSAYRPAAQCASMVATITSVSPSGDR